MTKIHLQAAVRLQREVAELEKALKKKRKWVGLTDEEITQGNRESLVDLQAWKEAVSWAESKLREKNT